MRAYNVTKDDLEQIADELNIGIVFGDGYKAITDKGRSYFTFNLKYKPFPDDPTKYRKVSKGWSGERRTGAVCFHGHFDFIYLVFRRYPNARIRSSRYGEMDYTSMESFQEQAVELAHTNIGAPICPISMIESCDCGCFGYGFRYDIDGSE